MTTENEMKPSATAEAPDGGRCAVDALFGVIDPHRQEMLWMDATPDEGYPLRILKAYRDNCDCRMVTNPPEMGEMMNRWQDERAEILDRAIAILSSPNND